MRMHHRSGSKLPEVVTPITWRFANSRIIGSALRGDIGAIRSRDNARLGEPFRVASVLPGDGPTNYRDDPSCLFLFKSGFLKILNRPVSIKRHHCQVFITPCSSVYPMPSTDFSTSVQFHFSRSVTLSRFRQS